MWSTASTTWPCSTMPRDAMGRPSHSTSALWPSGRKRWGLSTQMWPPASTAWRRSTTPKDTMRRPSRSIQRALAIREKVLGPEHPDVANSLHNLAGLYRVQGRYGEAETFYQRSLAILRKAFGPDHPDVATSLNNLAELYRAQGRTEKAERMLRRYRP